MIKVLVVEDSSTQAFKLQNLLEERGYKVTVAVNGKKALDAVQRHKPDLIISDIIMPEMDGYQLCSQIKADENTKDIPVILLTTLSDQEDIVLGLIAKSDYCITKPYNEKFLLTKVESILAVNGSQAREEPQKGLEVTSKGKRYVITSGPRQILNLLLSTYDNAVQQYRELLKIKKDLSILNETLEKKVGKKTAALREEITERLSADQAGKQAEKKLKESERRLALAVEVALKERIKELQFLYSTTAIAGRPGITLDEMYRQSANQIPLGWQYPTITGGCITIDGKVYKTKNFKQTKWMQRENIQVKDEIIGNVEVCYLQEKPDEYEGPFLKEERELIENFAKQLSEHITRKRAEDELKKLSIAIQQSPVSVVITDTKGNIEYVNPKFSDLTGYSAEEAIGKNPNILKTGVTPKSEYKKLWNTIKKGETWVGEFVNKKKNGELYWESATISPIIDDNNNITHFLAVKEDITEKKKFITDLMEREEKYRTLTQNLNVGVYRSTPGKNGIFIEANPAFLKMFEFRSKKELERWKVVDFYPDPLERKSVEEKLTSKGFLINEEVKLRKKDGTIFSASISATSAKDESGKVIHYDGIIEDVTEEHKAREDILAYQSNLKSLTNELIIAEERAKRRLAVTLHDKLGQSLVLAKFKNNELNKRTTDSEHKKMLDEINSFIEEAINESRNITYELSPPVLYEMGLIPAVSYKLDEIEKNNKIKTSLTDQSNSYEFDEKEQIILYRSINELLQNVIKHSKAQTVNVAIRLLKNCYRITVSDNGIGFDLEAMRDKAVSQKKFGLFSIMERIRFIGGEVIINTVPNKGTKVVINLPIKN